MKRLMRWWLVASHIVLILTAPEARGRKNKKKTAITFARGADYDDEYPGRVAPPAFREIPSQSVASIITITPETDSPHLSTKSTTTTEASLTTITKSTALRVRNNDPRTEPPLRPGRDSPVPAKRGVRTPKNVTQSTALQTPSTTVDFEIQNASVKLAINNVIIRRVHYQNVSQYQCHIKEGLRPKYRLCGYPLFYHPSDCAKIFCEESPMKQCENTVGMVAFVAVTIFLGLVIVAGNAIMPCLVARRKEMQNNHNYIKVSLSFADMLNGLVLISTILPNVLEFRSTAESEFAAELEQDNVNVKSAVVGALLALSVEASLLHLLFLSIERYLTIRWSIRRGDFKRRTIALILLLVWIVSIVVSIIPVIAPSEFSYQMIPAIFLFYPMAKPDNNVSGSRQLAIYVCLVMLLPYSVMVMVCFFTWLSVRLRRMTDGGFLNELANCQKQPKGILGRFRVLLQSVAKPSTEMIVFKTLLIMVIAFSLTLLPLMLVAMLFATGYYNCDNYSLPYTLSFYASISNSFVNVLIYSVRDAQFRNALCSKTCCGHDGAQANRHLGNGVQTSTDL